ncbi:TPA: hypothetical protein ACP0O4_001666 [Streptococcus pyogenes]
MKNSQIHFRVSQDEKKELESLCNKNGYSSLSSFLKSSAKKHCVFNLDLSDFFGLSSEVNYIGKNINTLIKKIYSYDYYTDSDIEILSNHLSQINNMLSKNYQELTKISKNLNSKNIEFKELINIVDEFKIKDYSENIELKKLKDIEKIFNYIEVIISIDLKSPDRSEAFNNLINVNQLFEFSKEELDNFYQELNVIYRKINMLTSLKKVDDLQLEIMNYAGLLRRYFS